MVLVDQPKEIPAQAEANGQLASKLGDVVRELDRRGHFVRWQKRVAAQSLQTVDSESGKSAIESLLRNAKNAIRSRDVGQIIGLRGNARSVQVIQAGAGNVDQSGRKRMRKAKRTLLGIRCLRTLLETAAVGDTAENTGNELGIVDKTKAVKQRVLLAKVDVHPRVKRVAMFIELR